MQPNAGVCAEADDVPSIWRYFWCHQHNVEHGLSLGSRSGAGWANPRDYGGTDHLAAAAMDCANGFA